MPPGQSLVAVLDIGKTNLKILLASAEGVAVESRSCVNEAARAERYGIIDIMAIEAWFIAQLAELGRSHPIGAIIATAHGLGAVLADHCGPVLPMMDYESPCPAWLDIAYAREAPPYNEVFCPIGAGSLRLAKQLLWQAEAFPEAFARARFYLTTPQYLAWRLGGRPASEISSLAAQGHVWAPLAGDFSSIVYRHGWAGLFPPLARAGEPLGRLRADLVERTGLPASTEILCGVHDSNANLYRYRAAGLDDVNVLSTGTWMIGFNRAMPFERMDARRAMVGNVSVEGETVASTLTMTGREYAVLAGEGLATDAAVEAAIPFLVESGTMALPSVGADDGLFANSARTGRIVGPHPATIAERRALASLYAGFTANACLDALESRGPVVVDGGFASNRPFGRLLAALRPRQTVLMSQSRDGTALGAALLWKRFERRQPVASVILDRVDALSSADLVGAFKRWQNLAETAGN
jgi:sugar (pentulose or hexulose) kinase